MRTFRLPITDIGVNIDDAAGVVLSCGAMIPRAIPAGAGRGWAPRPTLGLLGTAAAIAAAVAVFGSVAWAVGLAEANGASTIIMNRTQGPYRVVVGIIPARPVIPRTHLAIQVFDAVDERLLRDTDVRLVVEAWGPPGSPAFGPQPVLNEQTLRYFEVDLPFDAVGPWNVSLTVSSERGEERFVLPLEVGEPGAQIQWVWILAMMALIVAVGVWTWLTMRRRRAG